MKLCKNLGLFVIIELIHAGFSGLFYMLGGQLKDF